MAHGCKRELDRFKRLKADKMRWLSIWQLIGEYVHLNKQDFQNVTQPGDFLTEQVYDSTAVKSMRQASNGILSMVWKSASSSMIVNPNKKLKDIPEVKKWFENLNETLAEAMDDPRAGMPIAMEEYMYDQLSFGTSGVGCFAGDESDLLFDSYGVEEIFIDEGANGLIDTIYKLFEWDALRAAKKWGIDNLSSGTQQAIRDGKDGVKIKIVHVIEPRLERNKDKLDNKNMPIMSKYIELGADHIISESGFNEMPAYVSRFYKKKKEKYGRSPAMDALPDILEINATKEARSLAIEKSLDPPLGILHDSIMGNGKIDTSPRSINVINNNAGRAGSTNPIFPLFTTGEIREADKSIEDLTASIKEHFMLDRFLDTFNRTQMTLGEFTERQRRTAEAMQSIFTRIIRELLTPLIERSINILWRNKRFGAHARDNEGNLISKEIPEDIINLINSGGEFYDIKYFTPAFRIMQTEDMQGVLKSWEFAGQLAQSNPEVLDNLDADKSLELIAEITGAPTSIMKSSKEVKQIREARAAQQAQQQAEMKKAQEIALAQATGDAKNANKEEIVA